jgi:hypothetical protein
MIVSACARAFAGGDAMSFFAGKHKNQNNQEKKDAEGRKGNGVEGLFHG